MNIKTRLQNCELSAQARGDRQSAELDRWLRSLPPSDYDGFISFCESALFPAAAPPPRSADGEAVLAPFTVGEQLAAMGLRRLWLENSLA